MLASMKRVQLDSPHGRSATEVLAALNVSFSSGLSDHEAEQRLSVYGANAIGSRQKVGLIAVLVHQFQSLVVALLAVAAAVAFYFREWEEGGAIVGVLILNAATSAPRMRVLSRLNGWPMRSPVNASPTPSRASAHDSGSMRFATPSSRWTCTIYSLPVSRRTPVYP
jgi:hypothetical protein